MGKKAQQTDDPLFGYGATDEVGGGGKYLSFRKGDKGRVITIRLVSAPKYVNQHWITQANGKQTPTNCTGDACPYCGKEVPGKEQMQKIAKWGWIVIDREDGQVKVFTGPTLIARQIRELVENPRWGNPFLYDIEIKRMEEPGKGYYATVPIPDGKGHPITAEEKKLVEEAHFDLAEEIKGGRDSQHTGNYGAAAGADMETVPAGDIPENLGEADDAPNDPPF